MNIFEIKVCFLLIFIFTSFIPFYYKFNRLLNYYKRSSLVVLHIIHCVSLLFLFFSRAHSIISCASLLSALTHKKYYFSGASPHTIKKLFLFSAKELNVKLINNHHISITLFYLIIFDLFYSLFFLLVHIRGSFINDMYQK